MHASVPRRAQKRREDSEVHELRSAMWRCDTAWCIIRSALTESLPRGNCVLRWLSQLRHVHTRAVSFLASKSRPQLPVSRTRLTMTFRYRCDVLAYARKHLRFRWRFYICGIYYDIRALRNPTSVSPDRKRIAAVQLTALKIMVNRVTWKKIDF